MHAVVICLSCLLKQELLKDSYFWKVHVAWKEYYANDCDITKLSSEQQVLLTNHLPLKVFKRPGRHTMQLVVLVA